MRHAAWLLGLACVSWSAAGCSRGVIRVDQPEVFTRERILRLRQRDHDFLDGELKTATSYTLEFQGIQDTRTFTGLYNSLRGGYDPVAGAAVEGDSAGLALARGRSEELRDLDHKIALERRRGQLAGLEAGESPEPLATAASPASPERVSAPTAGATPLGVSQALPDPAGIESTKAKLTSQERLHETMAYREAVQSYLLEKQLDDTHDLQGFTLYTFKFDVSVLPREGNSSLGKVVLSVDTARLLDVWEEVEPGEAELYQTWRKYLYARMKTEQVALEELLLDNRPSREERVRIAAALRDLLTYTAADTTVARLEARDRTEFVQRHEVKFAGLTFDPATRDDDQRNLFLEASTAETPDLAKLRAAVQGLPGGISSLVSQFTSGQSNWAKVEANHRRLLAALIVAATYQARLGDLLQIDLMPFGEGVFQLQADSRGKGARRLKKRIADHLDQEINQPYVYSISPKQHAQNISRVAAQETLLNLMATVSAQLSSVAVEDSVQYVKRSQELLSSINRKILSTGYIDGKRSFGWILGPRFYLERKTFLGFELDEVRAAFAHQPAQHSYSVTLAVPAVLGALPLRGHFEWIDRLGNVVERAPLFRRKTSQLLNASDYDQRSGRTVVRLPGPDLDAVTNWLIARQGEDPAAPKIESISPRILQEGETTSLVILGLNLWRNPKVMVGGQAAKSIEILPDMQGIVARFEDLALPARLDTKKNASVDLTLVTSQGHLRQGDALTILPKAGSAAQAAEPKAKVETNRIVAGDTKAQALVLSVPTSSFADTAVALRVEISKKGSNLWVDVGRPASVRTIDAKTKRAEVQVEGMGGPAAFPWGDHAGGHAFEVRLRVQGKQGGAFGDPLAVEGGFVYFADAVAAAVTLGLEHDGAVQIVLEPSSKLAFPLALKIPQFEPFFAAYPGFEAALRAGKVAVFTSAQGKSLVLEPSWLRQSKSSLVIQLPEEAQFPAQARGELVLRYGKQTVPIRTPENARVYVSTAEPEYLKVEKGLQGGVLQLDSVGRPVKKLSYTLDPGKCGLDPAANWKARCSGGGSLGSAATVATIKADPAAPLRPQGGRAILLIYVEGKTLEGKEVALLCSPPKSGFTQGPVHVANLAKHQLANKTPLKLQLSKPTPRAIRDGTYPKGVGELLLTKGTAPAFALRARLRLDAGGSLILESVSSLQPGGVPPGRYDVAWKAEGAKAMDLDYSVELN